MKIGQVHFLMYDKKWYVLAQFFVAPIFRKQNKFFLYVCMYVCMYVSMYVFFMY
jgi:hypothetical protein